MILNKADRAIVFLKDNLIIESPCFKTNDHHYHHHITTSKRDFSPQNRIKTPV